MAHAYTPGLRVARRALVRKKRMLPIRGDVLVAKGERVTAEKVVARTELPGNVQLINIAHHLNIEPADAPSKLMVELNAAVSKGQQIAEHKGLFGLFRSHVACPSDGTIESVSKVTGQALLREPPIPLEVSSYISGQVTEVYESEGVEVATEGAFVQGILGLGGEKQGEILVVAKGPDVELRPEDLTEACRGKVVIGGRAADLATYRRAEAVGAVGLVVGSLSDTDLGAILGYDLGIAITGGEDLTTTLILTEGFGRLDMAKKTFDLLGSLGGRRASINGATQIRAGVIRPEVIVSLEHTEGGAIRDAGTETAVGSRVRIIRQPHFGVIAKIMALPPDAVVIESGAEVRVLLVELPDGTEHLLPRANVELIEE